MPNGDGTPSEFQIEIPVYIVQLEVYSFYLDNRVQKLFQKTTIKLAL